MHFGQVTVDLRPVLRGDSSSPAVQSAARGPTDGRIIGWRGTYTGRGAGVSVAMEKSPLVAMSGSPVLAR